MKKFLAFVLALVLTMGLCAISVPASADDNVELIVWLLGPGKQADSDEVWAAFNEQLHETLPNISVKWEVIAGDYKDRYARGMAAQERVDLAWIGWHNNIAVEAADGNILELDELLETYGQGIIAALGEDTINNHRLSDGKIYQLPSWQGMVGGRAAAYLPAELIEKSGVGENWLSETQDISYKFWAEPTVENQQALFDQFAMYYQGLVDADSIYNGLQTDTFTFTQWDGEGPKFTANYGYISFYDDTFTVKNLLDNEFKKNYYKNIAEFYDKGYIRSDIASAASTAVWDDGLDEQDVVSKSHNAWTDNYGAEFLTPVLGFDTEVVYNMKNNNYNLGSATGMCIPFTSKYQEEAMIFLNEMYTNAELYQTMIYGIEGKHWEENNDELNSINVFGGASQPTADFAYGLWCWTIGTCENVRKSQNSANNPDWYAQLKELEKTAYSSPLLGFSYDKTAYETELANMAALTGEYEDALTKGYLGSAGWEAHYNEYVDQMRASGMDEVNADAQEQVNAYLAEMGITSWNYSAE